MSRLAGIDPRCVRAVNLKNKRGLGSLGSIDSVNHLMFTLLPAARKVEESYPLFVTVSAVHSSKCLLLFMSLVR